MFSSKFIRLSYVIIMVIGIPLIGFSQDRLLEGWKTNTDKATIELDELKQGRPPKDKELETVTYGDYFSFAWLVFWPETEIYEAR